MMCVCDVMPLKCAAAIERLTHSLTFSPYQFGCVLALYWLFMQWKERENTPGIYILLVSCYFEDLYAAFFLSDAAWVFDSVANSEKVDWVKLWQKATEVKTWQPAKLGCRIAGHLIIWLFLKSKNKNAYIFWFRLSNLKRQLSFWPWAQQKNWPPLGLGSRSWTHWPTDQHLKKWLHAQLTTEVKKSGDHFFQLCQDLLLSGSVGQCRK